MKEIERWRERERDGERGGSPCFVLQPACLERVRERVRDRSFQSSVSPSSQVLSHTSESFVV